MLQTSQHTSSTYTPWTTGTRVRFPRPSDIFQSLYREGRIFLNTKNGGSFNRTIQNSVANGVINKDNYSDFLLSKKQFKAAVDGTKIENVGSPFRRAVMSKIVNTARRNIISLGNHI